MCTCVPRLSSDAARRMWQVAWALTLVKYKCWGKRRRSRPGLSGIPWQGGIISWKKERCDCTVDVGVFLRVCWSGPSQAVGSEQQHHRVPPEERGPWYRVCPDSLRAVWTCGGAWYLCYLQNLWVPIFSRSPTHLKYCSIIDSSHSSQKYHAKSKCNDKRVH